MRIEPGTDSGAADSEIEQTRHRELQSFNVALDEVRPAAQLLRDGQWCGVLQVSSSDLHHTRKLFRLRRDGVMQVLDLRNEFVQLLGSGDVHRGRERVV